MAYWRVTGKSPDDSRTAISYLILGPPGQSCWIYHLTNEKTQERRLARSSSDYEIGDKIHDNDISRVD